MDLHDRHDKGDATHEAEVPEKRAPAADHESVAQMVADCRGDAERFVKLIKKLSPAQLAEVVAAAQRLYGNKFVHDALALADPTSAHGGMPNQTGVHGLEGGWPDLFADQQDAKSAKTAENPRSFGGALQGRYGDTFGAERMSGGDTQHLGGQYNKWGGNGMPGMVDHKGDAGMFPNTDMLGGSTDVTATPTPGAPVPMPYPNLAGGTTGGSFNVLAPPTQSDSTTVPASNGDQAGASGGVASGQVMGASRSVTSVPTTQVGGAAVTRMTSSTIGNHKGATPREDQDGGGGAPVVLNRGDAGLVAGGLHRELAGQVGHAGNKGDGTGDTGNVAGSNAGGGLVASQRDKVGGRDLPRESGGNLDLDAALRINALVNPTRG